MAQFTWYTGFSLWNVLRFDCLVFFLVFFFCLDSLSFREIQHLITVVRAHQRISIEWYMYNVPANQLSISLALFSNRFRLYVLVVCRTHDEHLLSLKRTILAHTLSTKIAQLLIYSIRTYLSAQKHLTSESQMNESNNNNNNAHKFRTNFDVWLSLLPCWFFFFALTR